MRTGIGQRDDPGFVLDQRLNAVIDGVEEAADQPGVEVLFEAEIEQYVQRIMPGAVRNVGNRAVCEAGVLLLDRRRDYHALPVALEHGPRSGVTQIGAKGLTEVR